MQHLKLKNIVIEIKRPWIDLNDLTPQKKTNNELDFITLQLCKLEHRKIKD